MVREYEDYLIRTGRTVKRVRRLVGMAAEFLRKIEQFSCSRIESISTEMILSCFEQATDKPNFRNSIGTFFQYAYNRGMIESNLRHLIPSVVPYRGVPSVYSPEEVEQLLASIDRSTEIGKRNFAIILIAARLGLRASDIANLRFDNLKADKIEIVQFKTKQPLTTTLLDEVKDAIFDYVDHGRPQSSAVQIFLNEGGYGVIEAGNIYALTRRAFIRSGIECGIRKMGPHSLRASLATALLSEGNDYHTIQKVLGQMNITVNKILRKS
jgi:site-specific recombinase XerD